MRSSLLASALLRCQSPRLDERRPVVAGSVWDQPGERRTHRPSATRTAPVRTTREELRRRRQRLGWMGRAIVVEAYAAPQLAACSHFATVTIGPRVNCTYGL